MTSLTGRAVALTSVSGASNATGELLAHCLDHLPLPGHHLQRLGDVLAQLGELAATARAHARPPGSPPARAADMPAMAPRRAARGQSCVLVWHRRWQRLRPRWRSLP